MMKNFITDFERPKLWKKVTLPAYKSFDNYTQLWAYYHHHQAKNLNPLIELENEQRIDTREKYSDMEKKDQKNTLSDFQDSKSQSDSITEEDLSKFQKQLIEAVEDTIDERMDEFDDKLSRIIKSSDTSSGKVLDRYSSEVQKKFYSKLGKSGKEGLKKQDIMEIFKVKTSRANDLQHQLAADYGFIDYEQSGSNPGLTRHKKFGYIPYLATKTQKTEEELESYDLETLKRNYEEVKKNSEETEGKYY